MYDFFTADAGDFRARADFGKSDCHSNGYRTGESGSQDKKTLVATVFGTPIYLETMTPAESEIKRKELPSKEFDEWLRSYQVARIYDNIWGTVSRRYIEQEELSVSKDELDEITASVEQQMESNAEPPIGTTLTPLQRKGVSIAWASASLTDWKVCKSLYEKYGGRVGIGSLGGWTALDGQHALLREHHKQAILSFITLRSKQLSGSMLKENDLQMLIRKENRFSDCYQRLPIRDLTSPASNTSTRGRLFRLVAHRVSAQPLIQILENALVLHLAMTSIVIR